MSQKKWNIGWGPVSLCNMNCAFCYSKFKRESRNSLGIEDWIRFIDDNNDDIQTINYGTGENSLSDDWFVLVHYVRKEYPHILQALTTNGYISEVINRNPHLHKIFVDSIDEIDVSLDFAKPMNHNAFRGNPSASKWVFDTLSICKELNKRTTIVCLASKFNANIVNINAIFDIANTYNAIVRLNLYRPIGGINKFTTKFILPPQDLILLLRQISKQHSVLALSDVLFSNLLTKKTAPDPSGRNSLRILHDGSITPSTYLIEDNYILGNIVDGSIIASLTDSVLLKNIIYENLPKECIGCRYATTCNGGVYDRRYLWHGSLAKKDPYCLYEPGEPEWDKLETTSSSFQSIHEGYLPTMFFKPNQRLI